jgi:hypothetical protein
MPTVHFDRPLGQVADGWVGFSGILQQDRTISITAIVPRVSVYLRAGIKVVNGVESARDEKKIQPTTALPFVFSAFAGEECQALATDVCDVTFTLI